MSGWGGGVSPPILGWGAPPRPGRDVGGYPPLGQQREWRAVCPLRSRRRNFLLLVIICKALLLFETKDKQIAVFYDILTSMCKGLNVNFLSRN